MATKQILQVAVASISELNFKIDSLPMKIGIEAQMQHGGENNYNLAHKY